MAPAVAQTASGAGQGPRRRPPRRRRRQGALPEGVLRPLLKERLAQGQPDTPELRAAIRDELNTRELLVREAKKKGLDKNARRQDPDGPRVADGAGPRLRLRLDEGRTRFPTPQLRKEYDKIKTQIGDKEYKVRHILVEKEDEAKEIIVALQKGDKFEKLADALEGPGLEGRTAATSTGTRRPTSSSRSPTR